MKTPRVCLLLAAAIAAAPLTAGAQMVAPHSLPPAASITTANAAAALLRDIFFKQEYYDGIALGDTLARGSPATSGQGVARRQYCRRGSLETRGLHDCEDRLRGLRSVAPRSPLVRPTQSTGRLEIKVNAEAVRLARRAQRLCAQGR
jgi:hypothetical protein